MKKLIILIIILCTYSNSFGQTKEKGEPTPKPKSVNSNEKPNLPDSVLERVTLDLTPQEYYNIQGILQFLLSTSIPANQYVIFQEAIRKAKPVIIKNPNKK
jgi:hypothetical protein